MSSRKQVPAKKTLAKKTPTKKTPAKSAKKTPAKSGKKTPAKSGKKTPAKSGKDTSAKSAKKTSAKKATSSATPKVSPLRGLPVLQWVRSHASAWQAGVIANLIELVSSAVPNATCSIKWNQPVFELKGPMAFIRLAKDHVTFGFWRGAELTDPAGLLEGAERMKHLKIGDDEAFDRARVVGFVREAASLNLELGDPTLRRRRFTTRT